MTFYVNLREKFSPGPRARWGSNQLSHPENPLGHARILLLLLLPSCLKITALSQTSRTPLNRESLPKVHLEFLTIFITDVDDKICNGAELQHPDVTLVIFKVLALLVLIIASFNTNYKYSIILQVSADYFL